MNDTSPWSLKYKPLKVDDMVLSEELMTYFKNVVETGNLNNISIFGHPGIGKTTLLNVISGMDSYEEGELFIGGKSTSDYTIEDFENYRRANVAFIFQNYNIIDSFTVLQNVELSLMSIEKSFCIPICLLYETCNWSYML